MSAHNGAGRLPSSLNPNTPPARSAQPLAALSTNIPSRKAPSKTPAKGEAGRTPNGQLANRRLARYTPGKIVKPTTPHGIRAFEQRRAGRLTPARLRRRSAKPQRDTPRDLLRQLSRVLPRPSPAPDVTTHAQQIEEEESSEDDLSSESPRLSFGVYGDDDDARLSRLSIEKGRRALPDADRLLTHASLLAGNILEESDDDDDDDDDDDEDAPTTKLLDEDISEDEISLPTPTFDVRDVMGDTVALRQLMALTRSPNTPQHDRDPATPTADLSFALEIPDDFVPRTTSSERHPLAVRIIDDDDDGNEGIGGFDIIDEDEGGALLDTQEVSFETVSRKAPLGMGTIRHPLLDGARSTQDGPGQKRTKQRAPPRDGLPKGVVKRIASSFLRTSGGYQGRFKKGALDAILTASDWFFEQVSEDLTAYANHGGRKTIDESDAVMLIRRQKLLSNKSTLFSLAQRYLPGELLKNVRNVQRPARHE